MCGIVGGYSHTANALPDFQPAIKSLFHRGPDAQGLWGNRRVTLGHLRLSIVDVGNSAANQPMIDAATGNVLSFSGEIYNYRSLRETYLAHRTFRTKSDTEVLLYLLSDFDIEKVLSLISGMFAFAFYNNKTEDLILVRDPIGKKPLFITRDSNGSVLFSSEAKGFQALGITLSPSKAAVANFLFERTLGYGTMSFFEGVEQIEAGSYTIIDRGLNLATHRYWRPSVETRTDIPFDEALSSFRSLLTRAVVTRIPDEVPFVVLLSGGLDSSAIAALAARESGRDQIHTISAVYPNDPADESHWADQVISLYPSLKPQKLEIKADELEEPWHATTIAMEAPTPDGSMIAHHLLMRQIQKLGVKVALSGNGGDEILAGYANTLVPAGNVRALIDFDFSAVSPKEFASTAFHALPLGVKNAIFKSRHRKLGFVRENEDLNLILPRYDGHDGHDIVARYAIHAIRHWTTPGFVWYEDRNSMASSIEARCPFYDRSLVEFALTLPGSYLIRRNLTKRILRKALRGVLPDSILQRRDKQGFHAPIKTWMSSVSRDPLADKGFREAFDWLNMPRIARAGFLHRWRLLALHVWFRAFWPDRQYTQSNLTGSQGARGFDLIL